MLRRRYIEINDYNRNLVTLLQEHETKGTLKILKEERSLFGNNPLLPISVIAWKPINKAHEKSFMTGMNESELLSLLVIRTLSAPG